MVAINTVLGVIQFTQRCFFDFYLSYMLINEFVLVLSIIRWLSVYISVLASPDNHADMINLSSKRKKKKLLLQTSHMFYGAREAELSAHILQNIWHRKSGLALKHRQDCSQADGQGFGAVYATTVMYSLWPQLLLDISENAVSVDTNRHCHCGISRPNGMKAEKGIGKK